MSQDSSLVQWTTSTGAPHLARTAVGSAILSLCFFDCLTSSALNIKISAHPHVKMFQDLIFDRRTSRTAPLLPDIALHTLAPGDDDGNNDHDDHDGDDDYNNDDGNSPGTGPPGYTSPPSCQPLPWGGLHHDPDPQPTK